MLGAFEVHSTTALGTPATPQARVSSSASLPQYESRYTVVKNSWKGKYTRILCIGATSVATIHPQTLFKLTNTWDYGTGLTNITPDPESPHQLILHVAKAGGKTETVVLSATTELERADILTDVQRHRSAFDRQYAMTVTEKFCFTAKKFRMDEVLTPCTLRVTSTGIEVLRADTPGRGGNPVIGEYLLSHIKGMTSIEGRPNTLVIAYGPQMKLHLYEVDNAAQIVQAVQECGRVFIGLRPYREMKPLSMSQFARDRLGVPRDALETTEEYHVTKLTRKHCFSSTTSRNSSGGGDAALVSSGLQRLLGTAGGCLVERDPATYTVKGAYFLTTVSHLVRSSVDEQRFSVVFMEPECAKEYASAQRDAALAHVLDACRAVGKRDVCVMSARVDRGRRMCALRDSVTEEVESLLLKSLVGPEKVPNNSSSSSGGSETVGVPMAEVVACFNANIPYSGLHWSENKDSIFAENREKLIFDALRSILNNYPGTNNPTPMINRLQALRRLTVSRVGYSAAAHSPAIAKGVGQAAVNALRVHQVPLSYAAVDFLNSLMTPFHDHYEMQDESINKNRMLSAPGFVESLVSLLRECIRTESAALLVQALLEFFVYALCPPYSTNTDAGLFTSVMTKLVEGVGKGLVRLLNHACSAIRYSAAQLIRVVMEEGDEGQFKAMQRAALTEGGFLMAFNVAAFGQNQPTRDVSRRLLAYWAYRNTPMQDVLRRMLPLTLLNYLQSTEAAPAAEKEVAVAKTVTPMTNEYREAKSGWFNPGYQPRRNRTAVAAAAAAGATSLPEGDGGQVRTRVRQVRVQPTLNWDLLFWYIKQDLRRPDLIWNSTTREELRSAIEGELDAFITASHGRSGSSDEKPSSSDEGQQDVHVGSVGTSSDRVINVAGDVSGNRSVAWNYQEFDVHYHSLDSELRVGHHYPRLLFEEANPIVTQPKEFFSDLYHRFLLEQDEKSQLELLHGMAILYKHYGDEVGQFDDLENMVAALHTTTEPALRDRLLLFIQSSLNARHNIKLLIDSGGLAVLCELVTMAQLHIDRPQVQAITNAIEYTAQLHDLQGQEKEWFYIKGGVKSDAVSYRELKELYAAGEVTFTTKVWAQGMNGWRELSGVPQLRWGITCADKPSFLTYTAITTTIVDIFIAVCRHYVSRTPDGAVMLPLPKARRYLSSPGILPHLVQLLLTFDSAVCSRVHTLLYLLMEDNSQAMSRFFQTGFFFFSLMYTASDVLPLCRLLYLTHQQQAFSYPYASSALVRRSILAPLLPPAMICFLAHHGPERFADVLLGEYNTPEAIWGREMRRRLAGLIAAHVADFTPRLLGNSRVIYQYCPMASVEYPELESELFCGEYYLRHLCDELHYPDWPVRDPPVFLRDMLACWRAELDKKPSALTREGCLQELELLSVHSLSEQENKGDTEKEEGSGAKVFSPKQVRKAYFALATRFHPDKNPEGRDRFERVQAAYEFLIASASAVSRYAGCPDPDRLALLLRAQSILFQRCGEKLRAYKYAGYGLLLALIKQEVGSPDAFKPRTPMEKQRQGQGKQEEEPRGAGVASNMDVITVPLLDPAIELCYRTVANVPLNADELQEEGGIELLTLVVARCFDEGIVASITTITDAEVHARVATHCMLTFKVGAATLSECRQKMELQPEISFLSVKGITVETAPALSRACIEACEAQCASTVLQSRITSAGAIWHLLRFLFRYDPTLEQAGVALDENYHAQLFANRAATFALSCVYALVGLHQDGDGAAAAAGRSDCTNNTSAPVSSSSSLPSAATAAAALHPVRVITARNEVLYKLILKLLSPFIVRMMERKAGCELEVLKLLNSNSQTPYFIWNNSSRAELEELLKDNSDRCRSARIDAPEGELPSLGCENFAYSIHNSELVVGGVFLRLYISMPDFPIEDARGFYAALIQFMYDQLSNGHGAGAVRSAITCLRQLVVGSADDVAVVAASYMPTVVSFFSVEDADVQQELLVVLGRLLTIPSCAEALARVETTMSHLVFVLNESPLAVQHAVLKFLQSAVAIRALLSQFLDCGLYVFVINLFATSQQQEIKEDSCVVIAKAAADKLVGPKVTLHCSRLLPDVVVEAMKENPPHACQLLDTFQENPELIWRRQDKEALLTLLDTCCKEVVDLLCKGPCATYKLPDSVDRDGLVTSGTNHKQRMVQVGGVYLALYLEQPGWAVRKPKKFLLALLQRYANECIALSSSPSGEEETGVNEQVIDLIVRSAIRLLSCSPALRDTIVEFGYAHKILDLVRSKTLVVAVSAMQWVNEMMSSSVCVNSLAQSDMLRPLIDFLKDHPAQLPLVMDTLERIFSHTTPTCASAVMHQTVLQLLPEHLLQLLESGIPVEQTDQTPAALRALVIKVIKSMLAVPETAYRSHIEALLRQSTVWGKYKDQSHEMFLTQGPNDHFLTSGPSQAVRSLLDAPEPRTDNKPPPLE